VVSIAGDGGFMSGIQELAAAVQHDLGVVAVVFNNDAFGNVLLDQKRLYEGRDVGARLHNPDFAVVAEAFGAAGYAVRSPEELEVTLAKAITAGRPAVIEVKTSIGDHGRDTLEVPDAGGGTPRRYASGSTASGPSARAVITIAWCRGRMKSISSSRLTAVLTAI